MTKPRRWTQEQRARQAELIRRWQPWKTGGVKTPEGKARSCKNAYKHGAYSYETNLMRRYVTLARKQLAYCRQWHQRQVELRLIQTPPTEKGKPNGEPTQQNYMYGQHPPALKNRLGLS